MDIHFSAEGEKFRDEVRTFIREKLPPGFQRAEYLQEKGMVDQVVARADLPRALGQILSMLMGGARQAA